MVSLILSNSKIKSSLIGINTSKLNVIKENYFPKAKADDSDKLEDSVDQGALSENTVMDRYARAVSQSAKFGGVSTEFDKAQN